MHTRVVVNDRMQRNYVYLRTEPVGRNFAPHFQLARHVAQIANNCDRGDFDCHRRQRQAVLHWAYDSRRI